jgi:hypothetical protein
VMSARSDAATMYHYWQAGGLFPGVLWSTSVLLSSIGRCACPPVKISWAGLLFCRACSSPTHTGCCAGPLATGGAGPCALSWPAACCCCA